MFLEIRKSLLATVAFCLLLSSGTAIGQITNLPAPAISEPAGQQRKEPDDPWTVQQRREMAKKQNELRQQEIRKDADKLLELATELKQYVDKTNENILSMDVVKKAEQIEKLAKSVKDRMKGP